MLFRPATSANANLGELPHESNSNEAMRWSWEKINFSWNVRDFKKVVNISLFHFFISIIMFFYVISSVTSWWGSLSDPRAGQKTVNGKLKSHRSFNKINSIHWPFGTDTSLFSFERATFSNICCKSFFAYFRHRVWSVVVLGKNDGKTFSSH